MIDDFLKMVKQSAWNSPTWRKESVAQFGRYRLDSITFFEHDW